MTIPLTVLYLTYITASTLCALGTLSVLTLILRPKAH